MTQALELCRKKAEQWSEQTRAKGDYDISGDEAALPFWEPGQDTWAEQKPWTLGEVKMVGKDKATAIIYFRLPYSGLDLTILLKLGKEKGRWVINDHITSSREFPTPSSFKQGLQDFVNKYCK